MRGMWRRSRVALVVATWAVIATACGGLSRSATTTTHLEPTALGESLARGFLGNGKVVDADASACAATKVVNAIGPQRIYALGVRPKGTVNGTAVLSLAWTASERATVEAALVSCLDLPTVIPNLVIGSAPAGEKDAASCVAAAVLISPDRSRAVALAAIRGDQKSLTGQLSLWAKTCLKPEDVRVVVPPLLTIPGEQIPGQ